MSEESTDLVRTPLRVRERSRRTLDQRVALRLPSLAAGASRLVVRLPPRSRLRRALTRRAARLGYEAFNRRDLDAALLAYHPQAQLLPPRAMVESGVVEASYSGHDGWRTFFEEWLSVWGTYRSDPQELIDLGDRLLMLGHLIGTGEGSGIPVTQEYASLMTLDGGQVVYQQEFFDHAGALEAVGLSE